MCGSTENAYSIRHQYTADAGLSKTINLSPAVNLFNGLVAGHSCASELPPDCVSDVTRERVSDITLLVFRRRKRCRKPPISSNSYLTVGLRRTMSRKAASPKMV